MRIEEFIAARLDDDERIAAEARDAETTDGDPAEWFVSDREIEAAAVTSGLPIDWNDPRRHGQVCYNEGYPREAQAEHIALHDPARELLQVEATRQIFLAVLEYEGQWEQFVSDHPNAPAAQLERIRAVRVIASIWSKHPDYRPDWAP